VERFSKESCNLDVSTVSPSVRKRGLSSKRTGEQRVAHKG